MYTMPQLQERKGKRMRLIYSIIRLVSTILITTSLLIAYIPLTIMILSYSICRAIVEYIQEQRQ